MDKRAIGVFDSGLGGLTVLKEILNKLPNENTIYFGDTARVPYGSKSKEQILSYTIEAVEFFISKNVKAVVIACNTATVSALNEVRKMYDIPIIGVVEPGARAVSKITKNKEVLVIATEGTVKSGVYEEKIRSIDSDIKVVSKACPSFVKLVEDGLSNTVASYKIVEDELKRFKGSKVDSIVLGCTHFPYLRNEISECMGMDAKLVDPAIETTVDLSDILKEKGIINMTSDSPIHDFYVSGDRVAFKNGAEKFMEIKIHEVNKLEIKYKNVESL